MNRRLHSGLAALALGSFTLPAVALAQGYAHDPFFEQTVLQSQAFGLEMIGLRLDLTEAFPPPAGDDLAEQLEDISGADFARFGGTLEERDANLASALQSALDEVEDAVREGKDVKPPVSEARDLLKQAYDKVIGPDIQNAPEFKGAVMIQLLLAEGGVAEAYEEAAENKDVWEYPAGWAALQRVKALWSEIEDRATDQRRSDGQEMIDALDQLFPNAGPPSSVAGWNPEEAENPAQRLSGILEEVTDANLYPDRDLPRLAGHLADITGQACKDYAAGKDDVAAETIHAAFDHYGSHIRGTLMLFSPEIEQSAGKLFGEFITVDDDDDDDGASSAGDGATAAQDDDEDKGAAATDGDDQKASVADTCEALQRTLVDVQKVLGG